MSAAIGGGSRRLSCSTFACCASMRKSKRELPVRATPADCAARRGTSRRRRALRRPDGRATRRRNEKNVSPWSRMGADESPLLHVAQMIVAHVLVALEQLTLGDVRRIR